METPVRHKLLSIEEAVRGHRSPEIRRARVGRPDLGNLRSFAMPRFGLVVAEFLTHLV